MEETVAEESLTLEPLPQFSLFIPEGWQDAIYGPDGSGSSGESKEWWLDEAEGADGRTVKPSDR